MEENNDIFLAGGDALVYLVKAMHKKYSTFIWYVRILWPIFQLPSPCTLLHPFFMTSPWFPYLRSYLMDGLFLNQKQITTFEYRIHWNINILLNILFNKI